MPKPKVLFIVTSHKQMGNTKELTGFHLSEMTGPFMKLIEAGIAVDISSPKGGPAPVDPASYDLEQHSNKSFFKQEEFRNKIEKTIALHEVNANQYSAVYFPGGHGAMWDFPGNAVIESIVSHIYDSGGYVGAVCHGPAAFADLKLTNGEFLVHDKKITCFSNSEEKKIHKDTVVPFLLEDKLIERGGHFSAAAPFEAHVMDDQRLITGQNPASAEGIALRLIKHLL